MQFTRVDEWPLTVWFLGTHPLRLPYGGATGSPNT